MSQSSPWEEQLAGFLAYTAIGLVILGLIVAVWFLVKCFELVVRVLVAHPDNRPAWLALGSFLLLATLAALAQGQQPLLNGLAGASLVVLVMVAKITEIYYDQLFQRELAREQVVEQVLHEPWWNAA
jgi:hypothetical protein